MEVNEHLPVVAGSHRHIPVLPVWWQCDTSSHILHSLVHSFTIVHELKGKKNGKTGPKTLCNCVFKLEKKLLKIKKKIDSVESLTTLSMTPRCQWHRCAWFPAVSITTPSLTPWCQWNSKISWHCPFKSLAFCFWWWFLIFFCIVFFLPLTPQGYLKHNFKLKRYFNLVYKKNYFLNWLYSSKLKLVDMPKIALKLLF